jgi:tRNA G18 (ribose-2'-O)-methylase SpoU
MQPNDDSRNVTDEFKGQSIESIMAKLDKRGIPLEIAIENTLRDFNMGTIVRTANAFGIRTVHVIGRRQWNKRGAMMTDKYLRIVYHESVTEFIDGMKEKDRAIIAIDNVGVSKPLASAGLPLHAVLVFGQEGPGLSDELLNQADAVVAIEQLGSTRSINVGVAAGIVMYEWLRRHKLS